MRHFPILFALLLPTVAAAQPSPVVPYETAVISFQAPPPPGDPAVVVDATVVRCGTTPETLGEYTATVPAPGTSIQATAVIPSPGVYVCAIAWTNIAGTGPDGPVTPPFALTPAIPPVPPAPTEPPVVSASGG